MTGKRSRLLKLYFLQIGQDVQNGLQRGRS
jgi:hypothetical protein